MGPAARDKTTQVESQASYPSIDLTMNKHHLHPYDLPPSDLTQAQSVTSCQRMPRDTEDTEAGKWQSEEYIHSRNKEMHNRVYLAASLPFATAQCTILAVCHDVASSQVDHQEPFTIAASISNNCWTAHHAGSTKQRVTSVHAAVSLALSI